MTTKIGSDYEETLKALYNAGERGWRKKGGLDPNKVQSGNYSTSLNYDPTSLKEADRLKEWPNSFFDKHGRKPNEKEIAKRVAQSDHFLNVREIEVRGCIAGRDCYGIDFRCSHFVPIMHCKIGRIDIAIKKGML